MALPGTPGQRISDLCNGNHISQKQLAEKIGVSASQLSRIVSGETKTVSSDILIGVAKEFKVSTDYILGLSTLSVRKSYDISELGLSEGAVRGLVTGTVDVQIFNRLLEHRNFPKLMDDFGSGYSSLNVLKDIDLDVLKIDMKFLSKGKDDGRGEKILAAVIQMAKALDMPVIAEGVEEKKQVQMLKRLGCNYIQGYYFAKPMPQEDYERLARKSHE